jgi:hypothetical protein
MTSEWHGIDLDRTLAEYHDYEIEIGTPIPRSMARVKRWLARGERVKLFTARANRETHPNGQSYLKQMKVIHDWLAEHNLPLEVTASKDYLMKDLYDDRVIQVEANTGLTLKEKLVELLDEEIMQSSNDEVIRILGRVKSKIHILME